MDESSYYHAIAIAARGGYHAIKRLRGNAEHWAAAYRSLRNSGAQLMSAERAHSALAQSGIRLTLFDDPLYPEPLRHIAQPPFGIYVRGVLPDRFGAVPPDAIAIVGTRRATAEGKRTAHDFAQALGAAGFAIVSGLAFGIDAAAHDGCLDAGQRTVAVLAGGVDQVYPRSHDALARRIIEGGGAIISEYPPGEPPIGYRFIERNRIVSGLARGVVIVEAPESSGALATARYAIEQDRDVFVVPGPASSANFRGSHTLIRQGAELTASPDEILEAYGIASCRGAERAIETLSAEETLVFNALREIGAAADVDKLSEITKLEPRIINRILSVLIIMGNVRETDSGYILVP